MLKKVMKDADAELVSKIPIGKEAKKDKVSWRDSIISLFGQVRLL